MATVSMDVLLAVVGIFATIILTIIGWLLAGNRKTQADMAAKLETASAAIGALTTELSVIKTALIGIDGNNGMNSELKKVRRTVRRHAILLQTLQMDYKERREPKL